MILVEVGDLLGCRVKTVVEPFYHEFNYQVGGGFKHFLCSPLPGEMIHFDYIIFFRWVETTNQLSMDQCLNNSLNLIEH